VSIVDDYEDLSQLVRAYDEFAQRFARRVFLKRSPMRGVLKGIRSMRSPYSRPTAVTDLYQALATDSDKADPLFGVVTAASPAEALANHYLDEHPWLKVSDVKAIAELHRLHSAQHAASSPSRMLAIVLSVTAVVGQTIPKEAFDYLRWTIYEAYSFYATLFTIGAAAYVLLLVALMARATRNSAPRRGVELVLVFVESRLAKALER
jgi:hypothetical protein